MSGHTIFALSSGRPPANIPSSAFANGYSGPSFFDRLFGPPTPPAPVGRRAQQQPRRVMTR